MKIVNQKIFWTLLHFAGITFSGYTQSISTCDIRTLADVENIDLRTCPFRSVDTIVDNLDYNVIYQCPDGSIFLGNIDKKGKKTDDWRITQPTRDVIKGEFKRDKMSGTWYYGNMKAKYVRGKSRELEIPF